MEQFWALIRSEELIDLEARRNRKLRLLTRWGVDVLLELLLPKYLMVTVVNLVRCLLK